MLPACLVLAGSLGCQAWRLAGPGEAARPVVSSNILRRDYAGSAACARCHAEIHQDWAAAPMRRMTRLSSEAPLVAPFGRGVFDFRGDRASLELRHGQRFVRLTPRHGAPQLFRVTKIVGGRTREDFVGAPVHEDGTPEPGAEERVMPVSFLRFDGTLRYKGYSVMIPERPELRPGAVWRRTCIFCHNTTPLVTTLYDDLLDGQAETYQGSQNDGLLPADRRWRYEVRDAAGLGREVAEEIARAGGPDEEQTEERSLDDLLRLAIRVSRTRFGQEQLVEVGIGCEACHGGSREHARDPRVLPSFEPRSPLLRRVPPDGRAPTARAPWINRTCVRCHSVLFTGYPYTWEGGDRKRHPGGSSISSGEARDFLLGGCATRMSCADCHALHDDDRAQRLRDLEGPAGARLCTGCHERYRGDAAVTAHTHHRAASPGSACLSCHMARKNMGLTNRLTRYHRIGSPDDAVRVEGDRPLECALCHGDRSVAALVGDLERWWGRRFDRGRLRALYGDDLEVNVLEATLARGKPHEQAVALGLAAEGRARLPRDAVLAQLGNGVPLVRYYAKGALERLVGRPLPLDMTLPAEDLVAQARALLESGAAPRAAAAPPATALVAARDAPPAAPPRRRLAPGATVPHPRARP